MATSFPQTSITIDAQATSPGGGGGYVAVFAPCASLADGVPRLYASGKGVLDAHGFCEGTSYAAMHINETRRPVVFVGMPIETKGASSAVVTTAWAGTSEVTLTDNATTGCLTEVQAILRVVVGGTRGTAGVVLELSLDNGVSWKSIRLGTAVSYAIPNINVTINFGAGTFLAGEYVTWTATGPQTNAAGLTLARNGLAAKRFPIRTVLATGVYSAALATNLETEANAYASANERFVFARCAIADKSTGTWPVFAATQAGLFDGLEARRVSTSLGHRRKQCPLTSWSFRRPAAWAASLREYRRDMDLHNSTWWRGAGPLDGWFLAEGDDEYDERVHGGALAGKFTTFATLANGSTGMFIAKDLTRAALDSPLLLPNNMAVTNEACTICQRVTQRWLGQSLVLQTDGTADPNSLADLEEAINSELFRELLAEKVPGRGPRASAVRWEASKDDDLRGAAAVLNGVLTLNLRGTISQVATQVKVI
jgi:hypothetical protein